MSIASFCDELISDGAGYRLGRVREKFLRSMLIGIEHADSLNLTSIAGALDEGIRLHATQKRLSRNLDDQVLFDFLQNRLLSLATTDISNDSWLVVHTYSLEKRYAKKIEYLGPTGRELDHGFKVCEVLAIKPEKRVYKPLVTHVWSNKIPDFESDSSEVAKTLDRVLDATGNKGLVFFDDQSVGTELVEFLINRRAFDYFSMMRSDDAKVVHKDEEWVVRELFDQIETKYGRTMFKLVPEGMLAKGKIDLDLFLHAGALGVKRVDDSRRLTLIALRAKTKRLGEISIPILTTKIGLRSRKSLMGLVESFLSIQDVVSLHQEVRARFRPEEFRVLTYRRLRLLFSLLQAVIFYRIESKGSPVIEIPNFADQPHTGELDRTYLMPRKIDFEKERRVD